MRRFHSYGPVDSSEHFAVERRVLVNDCATHLVGHPEKGGHFFTLWAPRQSGKTWLMRRAIEEVRARHGDRFVVGSLLMQGVMGESDGAETFFRAMPRVFQAGFGMEPKEPANWEQWMHLFSVNGGIFDRPLILLIDEFDGLPAPIIDELVGRFRAMYLTHGSHVLHGLALVGVRAVLGVESDRGSPFNVQRSLRVPNLTADEVGELFSQYEAESGQRVDPEVSKSVYTVTRGQPGLVSWFGELLTEKYNPGPGEAISSRVFNNVVERACRSEQNNTILNLIAKARTPYAAEVVSLFTDPNVPFFLDKDWCNYLYMNGIIDKATSSEDPDGTELCRFSSPFVQRRLYAALTHQMFGEKGPLPAIPPGDLLSDVFTETGLSLAPLLERYRGYLKRLKAAGLDPWKGQPRRRDQHLTEAVGHFHLYPWLQNAVGRRCIISPEFPTGNGKVDLVLRTRDLHVSPGPEGVAGAARDPQIGLIEVKSFVDMAELEDGRAQAARYAKKLALSLANLVVFVPVDDGAMPPGIAGEAEVEGVTVVTIAFGWI